MQDLLNKLTEGLGIEPNTTLLDKEINLGELKDNPYDGTFKMVYDLVKEGKVAPLSMYGQLAGISVQGPEGMNDDLAGRYYQDAYGAIKGTYYALLAMQLITANLTPQEIVNDGTDNLKVRVLGERWLDMKGDVTTAPVKEEPKAEVADADDVIYVKTDNHGLDVTDAKRYLRKKYGRCFAKGEAPTVDNFEYVDNGIWKVINVKWGRKLTEAERDAIEVSDTYID